MRNRTAASKPQNYKITVLLNSQSATSMAKLCAHHNMRRAGLIDNMISRLKADPQLHKAFMTHTRENEGRAGAFHEKSFSFLGEYSARLDLFSFTDGFRGNKSAAIRALCLFFAHTDLNEEQGAPAAVPNKRHSQEP
jgi:hypothetical protein